MEAMLVRPANRLLAPVGQVARAAVRPATYPGHLREAVSVGITAAAWPFGLIDRGLVEVRRRAGAEHTLVDTPVLLVHGYGANKSNWVFLERWLRDAGFGRVDALNYNPLRADVPELAEACTRRAREVMAHYRTDRIHLIGHSLGGIVARYAVQLGGLTQVGLCATVASPHQGVPLARFGVGATARSLCPDSAVLRRLSASTRRTDTRFVAYYSNLDVLVPARRAMIREPAARAANVLVKDEGHVSILLSRRLATSLVTELGAVEGLPGAAASITGLHSPVPDPVGALSPAESATA